MSPPATRCPFYGFALAPSGFAVRAEDAVRPVEVDESVLLTLFPTLGNQCALVVNAHAPCRMELEGETPNWSRCRHFNADPPFV